ncbi:MAG TPA: hypothetical protein VHY22_03450 [Chthoniobacteraceae bacterium]|nr:hypothetical protein [Chthoniobacteraceae bacterium]
MKIVLFTTFAAVGYGIVHDEITAHVCVEYFTLAHPPLFHTESPAALGICWGIAATIGIGIVLGFVLATAARSGEAPQWPEPKLMRAILALLGAMAIAASLAGVSGYELARHSLIHLPESLAQIIRPVLRDRFMGVWFAHIASYLVGLGGGAFLIFRVWRDRGSPNIIAPLPVTKAAILRTTLLVLIAALVIYFRFFRES